jgi:hypothetical protein
MVARASTPTPVEMSDQAVLESIRSLEQRLHDGYEKIEEGLASGRNVAHWEGIWLDLLREYEELVDMLAA